MADHPLKMESSLAANNSMLLAVENNLGGVLIESYSGSKDIRKACTSSIKDYIYILSLVPACGSVHRYGCQVVIG